ncbi:MAG: DndE family protein [Roseomonas sp.]|nr:DndE family protein [Roseomonas sp.]
MALNLLEVSTAGFRTTRDADQQCEKLKNALGYKVNYLVARLAIARSLALPDAPPVDPQVADDDDSGRTIRGHQLFGEGPDAAAWVSLLVQRAVNPDMSRRDLQAVVLAHWKRGAQLLTEDWEAMGHSLPRFVERLASAAGLPETSSPGAGRGASEAVAYSHPVAIPIGEVAEDTDTGEAVTFPLNAPGGSPHMAIMGGAGSGKTRTAARMLRAIRDAAPIPFLAFDFKGDLASAYSLDTVFAAQVVAPPRASIPLDVLAVGERDDITLKEAAARFRDSFARIKKSALSGQQGDLLREAVLGVLRAKPQATISDVREAVKREYDRLGRRPDEMLATLNELTSFVLFEPKHLPADFFSKSWIISLPPTTPDSVKKLVVNLTLDALDRWINSLPESKIINGYRGLRHLCMIDEAHQILETKLPALGNLVRMSRSKGGVIMLISQSPNDFSNEDDDFLDNVGMTLAFNTQAQPGPTKRIFGQSSPLTSLAPGEALSRVRSEARTRRIVAWR